MAAKSRKSGMIHSGQVSENRRARHDYTIEETFDAGIMLTGSEVKAVRMGRVSIAESYATVQNGVPVLVNSHMGEWPNAPPYARHQARRVRILLLKGAEIRKLVGAVQREGMTLVPLSLYFTGRGFAKIKLGLAKGRKKADMRQAIKERDWKRRQGRLLRESGVKV